MRPHRGYKDITPVVVNQKDQKMDNEMETGVVWSFTGIRVSQN